MSHYLKLMMDCIFGEKNFRNEIVWKRMLGAKGNAKGKFYVQTDQILFYSKSNNYIFNKQYNPLSKDYIKKFYTKVDEYGRRYRGAGGGRPSHYKYYLDESKGTPIGSLWDDINNVQGASKESTGYPTQKPLKLLERIISSSSNENDIILDPFCGCATTCVAAEKLGRKWVGIDVSRKAFDLVKMRLEKEIPPDLLRDEPDFKTDPPNRNKKELKKQKCVYVISKPNSKKYKVGVSIDPERRVRELQTGDSDGNLNLEFSSDLTSYFRQIERYVHKKYKADREWVTAPLDVLKKEIENLKSDYEQY